MPKARHIHRYIKRGDRNNYIWRCGEPDCAFFVYRKQEDVIEGRSSICWECSKVFPMDEEAMKEEMPRCADCRNGIDESHRNFLDDFLSKKS